MANKISNVSYDQIPHIVINHPDTNPEHKEIMRALFKVLKDASRPITYTNETLSENCRIPLRTIERRIVDLVKMGLIHCTGRGYNRRISLGLLFNNSANMAVKNLNNSAKSVITTAKSDPHNRQCGGDYNTYTKSSTNGEAHATSTPKPHNQEYQDYAGGIIHKVKFGELPKGTKPLSLDEWIAM